MKSWERIFEPHILERGRDYFESGRVHDLSRTDDGFSAIVSGTDEYEVDIKMSGTEILDMYCDCPYAYEGNYCKHMAAVLFEIMDGEIKHSNCKKETAMSVDELVKRIPEQELQALVTRLAREDHSLYRTLLLKYGNASPERLIKTLHQEEDALAKQYTDRYDYIDYDNAYAYAADMADFIQNRTSMLLEKEMHWEAFEIAWYGMNEFCSYEMDDSDGGASFVGSILDTMCGEVLSRCSEDDAQKIFNALSNSWCEKSNWLTSEFAEELLFSNFQNTAFRRQKLALLDRQLQKLSSADEKSQHFFSYELRSALEKKIELLRELSATSEEWAVFLKEFGHVPVVRRCSVQRLIEEDRMDEAIVLLKEGKAEEDAGSVQAAEYSQLLIDIYRQADRQDELLAELEYYVFTFRQRDLHQLLQLKQLCAPAQWEEYREKYLSQRDTSLKLALLQEEELWERLLECVVGTGNLYLLDEYAESLRKHFPDQICRCYADCLQKQAQETSNRKQYRALMPYLKKFAKYLGGEEMAAQLAADWRVRYRQRSAMMDELKKAGF